MIVDLDRKDLEALVKGSYVGYSLITNPLIKKAGYYIGGFHDEWRWNSSLEQLTNEELFEIYMMCKTQKGSP